MDFEQLELDRWADDGGSITREVEISAPMGTSMASPGARPALSENEKNEMNFAIQDCIRTRGGLVKRQRGEI